MLIGVGLDVGEAVAVEGGFRGSTLNLASRLCAQASPGEILASESVVHLAHHVDGLSYVTQKPVRLKGIEQQVRFVRVVSDPDSERLQRAIDAVHDETPRLGPRHVGRRTPARLAVVAVGAIVVLAALVLAAARIDRAGHLSRLGTNMVGALDSSGHIVGQVPVGGRPGGVAADAGSVWATNTEHDTIVQIDRDTRRVVDTVPVGVRPTGIAVGGGGVWVTNSGGQTVAWINSKTPGRPVAIQVGQGPGPIAYGQGAAWVVNITDGTLQRIGPDLNPSKPVPIGGSPTAVAVGGGSVWVTDSSSGSLLRIDSGTLRVTDRITVGTDPQAVAYSGRFVWVANGADGTVTRLDPASNAQRAIVVGGTPTALAYSSGALWVARDTPAGVVRIDPKTLAISATKVGSEPQSITGLGGQVWVGALSPLASHKGGTLRVLFGGDPNHSWFGPGYHIFDPTKAVIPAVLSLLAVTNDGLVALRRAGGAAGGEVVPDLAASLPVVTDGGRTYTFRIRPEIRYSNGDQVRASDFRFALERLLVDARPRPLYGSMFFLGVRGARVCQRAPARCSKALAAGIQPDDHSGTLVIHLVSADPSFLYKLATTFADLLPPDSPGIGSGRPVPATGPYMITQVRAKGFMLKRNPYFREWSHDAQPAGFADQIKWSFVPSPGKQLDLVEHRNADVALEPPPSNRLAELRTTYATLAHPYLTLTTRYVALNTRVSPFNHSAVRRAFNFAVDRRKVIDILGGTHPGAVTCQLLPPTMLGFKPYCPYTDDPNPASGAWVRPDLAKARQLVRSTHTRGERVAIWACSCLGATPQIIGYLTSVLNSLGYKATPQVIGYDDWIAKSTYSPARWQATYNVWGADYPRPASFLQQLLSCAAFVPHDPDNLNASEFCNHPLDALMRSGAHAEAAGKPALSADRWHAADKRASDLAPLVPLTNNLGLDVVSNRAGNYQNNPQFGILLNQLWVK